MSMPIADVNGCKLYYEANGTGPEVVLIHGEDHGIEMFEQQVAELRGNYRCVTYYRRGHARSELTPYGYSSIICLWMAPSESAALPNHAASSTNASVKPAGP